MARGFNWDRIGWQDRLRKQGDQHHGDTKKKTQIDSKIAALKAAQTIRRRHHKTTQVVETK